MTPAEPDRSILHSPRVEAVPRRLGSSAIAKTLPSPNQRSSLPGFAEIASESNSGVSPEAIRQPLPAQIPPELIRAAEHRGYEAGFAKGNQAVRGEFRAVLERLDILLESIAQKRDDLLEVLEDDLVELAFEAAALVIGDAGVQRDLVVETVRRVLAQRSDAHIVVVRIAPADLKLVAESESGATLGLGSRIRLLGDPEIALGGCVIDTGQGTLDARLELLLAKLRSALLEARSKSADAVRTRVPPLLDGASGSP